MGISIQVLNANLLFIFFICSVSFSVNIGNITNVRLAVFGVHGDCHEESIRNGLKKLSDGVLTLTEPNFDGKGSAKCQITTYKTRGKNSQVVQYYHINSSLEFKHVEKTSTISIAEDTEDPNLETTFNIGLKVSERRAKTQVELPFWRPEQKAKLSEVSKMTSERGSGEIIYVADETDDCDEEDPDDELNI